MTRCQCFCECAGTPDAAILELLRGQLDRCGPENLAPPTPRCSCWSPSAILFLLFACGCTCLLLGYALAVWRLKKFDGKDLGDRDAGAERSHEPGGGQPGLRALRGPTEPWHERLLGAHLGGSRWVVATPTHDVYDEDLEEMEAWIPVGPRGGTPMGLRGQPLFRFDSWKTRTRTTLLSECAVYAAAWHKKYPAEEPPSPLPPGPIVATGAVPADVLVECVGGETPVGPASGVDRGTPTPPPTGRWVVLEDRFGFDKGDAVDKTQGKLIVSGDRALWVLEGIGAIAVGKPGSFAAGGSRDLRTLPVLYSASGDRKRPFANAVSLFTETAQDGWGIEGPRTTAWLAKAIADGGHTPVQRHFWWRSVLGVSASDAGIEEHLFLSELMEVGSSFDQLNLGECAVFEAISRRYQVWEEAYSTALRHSDLGTNAEDDGLWVDERRLFLGARRARGSALVSPLLEKHVATRLSEEAAILKERRKGREEKLLAKGDAVVEDKTTPKPKAKRRP